MIPRPCRSCRRLNPYQATYCYFDGVPLETGVRGAAAGGSERFPKPFVFPSGHACGSFLELAHACRENWNEARRLLKDGEFLPFLAGLGRIDLVQAAERAAAHPDLDRGLDDLLVTLPGSQAKAACLEISNAEIDVGSVAVGQDRKVTLTIVNTGERLLTGVARGEDCLWLGLHNPQLNEKTFRAPGGGEWQLQLHIRGQQLRARPQPQVGLVVIESNGGVAQVDVRIRVPVTPFPDGVLKGAQTPRQLAEKAKTNPQEVAALLENGSVERWFQRNGWTYPITVPRVSGLAAVQQYFEALGLTTPPRVEPSTNEVTLRGAAGGTTKGSLVLSTLEKRPVYAQAQADQPWLVVGPVECRGSKAVIPLNVAQVPAFPGQTIHAQLSVQANGKQSFKIPVRLHVGQPGSGGAKALKNSGQHAPHLSEAPVTSLPARAETVVVESASRSFAKVPVSPLPPLPPLPDQSTAGPGLEPIPLLEARVDSAGARSRRRLALVCLLLSFLLLVSAAALAAWKILIKDREGTVPALVGPSS